MNPTKLPSGSWRLKVYLGKDANGKRIYQSVTHVNKRECIRIANDLAQHHHEISRDASTMTLREGMERYIKMNENILSPSTIRGYTQVKNSHFLLEQNMRLSKINSIIMQEAVNRELETYSPKTVNNAFGLVTAVMNKFTRTTLDVTLPKAKKKQLVLLTKEQLSILINALQGHDGEIVFLMAIFLGLRRSEIVAFDPETDYCRETRILHVSRAIVQNKNNEFVEKDTTKTPTGDRYLTVPPYLAEKIEAKIDAGEPLYSITPGHMATSIRRVCRRCGLPELSLHDLRHQNASIMLSIGIPDKYAMERGGWASNYVMKQIYQHTMSDKRREVDGMMNEYIQELVAGISANA